MAEEWLDRLEAADNLERAKRTVARLAALAPLEYQVVRRTEAKSLGISVSVLDAEVAKTRPKPDEVLEAGEEAIETLEPWGDPVDGASLAEEVRERLRAHVIFGSAPDPDAATLWVFGTYLMDTWRLWPRLMITSPTKQCGKSTLLEVLDAMVFRGLIVSNTKSAGVFRAIEAWRPCLLLDEADTWMRDDAELGGILNSGHTHRTARVIRVQEVAGELTPAVLSTWAAMAIAGIGKQRDTLVSRSILIGLRRKLPAERVERLPYDLHPRLIRVRRQIARWTADNSAAFGAMTVEPPECGDDRRLDNFTPLWRLAAALGGPWPDRVSAAYAAQAAVDDEDDEPAGVLALRDLAGIFAARSAPRIATADALVEMLNMEDRPWSEWRHGRPLTAQSLAKLLRPFEVRPQVQKLHGTAARVYLRKEVESAVSRYHTPGPEESRNPVTCEQDQSVTPPRDCNPVTDQTEHNPLRMNGSYGVTDFSEVRDHFEASDDPSRPEAWK